VKFRARKLGHEVELKRWTSQTWEPLLGYTPLNYVDAHGYITFVFSSSKDHIKVTMGGPSFWGNVALTICFSIQGLTLLGSVSISSPYG
jgi:hypothetical protein